MSNRLRLANFIQAQISFPDADGRPRSAPCRYVSRLEMFVERLTIDPAFLYMNQAAIKNILSIGILEASFLRSAGLDH